MKNAVADCEVVITAWRNIDKPYLKNIEFAIIEGIRFHPILGKGIESILIKSDAPISIVALSMCRIVSSIDVGVGRDLTRSRYKTVPRDAACHIRGTIEWCTNTKSMVLFYGIPL